MDGQRAIREMDDVLHEGAGEIREGEGAYAQGHIRAAARAGLTKQKVDEIRAALRELGLDEDVETQ